MVFIHFAETVLQVRRVFYRIIHDAVAEKWGHRTLKELAEGFLYLPKKGKLWDKHFPNKLRSTCNSDKTLDSSY